MDRGNKCLDGEVSIGREGGYTLLSENIQYLSIKCAILLMCLKSHDSNIKDH